MNRRFARWIGPVLVVLPQLLLFWFRTDPLTPTTVATYLALTLGGLLLVVAGIWPAVTIAGRTVPWNVSAGLANVTLGAGFLGTGLAAAAEAQPDGLVYAAAATIGGVIIAAIGVDIARGGRHFRVEAGGD